MKPRVYIETSVVSYLTARASRDVVTAAQQVITQQWWEMTQSVAKPFDLRTSQLTLDEASRGDPLAAQARLASLSGMPILGLTAPALQLGQELVAQLAIPAKAVDDAYHVAIAAVHGMEYLATWNCRHIANAHMRQKIVHICQQAGFTPVVIATPQELFL